MTAQTRPFAVVTGASSGIGFELARCCVAHGYDLLIAADDPSIRAAAENLSAGKANVEPLEVDLATLEGVDKLYGAINGRPVAALLANAGRGLGHAFLDQRAELKDTGVTVTCLMPGATETKFFERAGMLDTKVGTQKKQAASEVAQIGFEAMLRGDGDVVAGWKNKLQAAVSHILPSSLLAEVHRGMAAPGTASKS